MLYTSNTLTNSMKVIHRSYVTVIIAGWLYSTSYFFHGSLAPIIYTFITDYNATLTQIALMLSLFWLTHVLFQIPIILSLQYAKAESIMLISSLLFVISCGLFAGIGYNSILLPTIFMLLSGVFTAPFFLCFVNIVSTRYNADTATIHSGLIQCANVILLVTGNIIQAYLYQQYAMWQPVYWMVSIFTLAAAILFMVFDADIFCHTPGIQFADRSVSDGFIGLALNETNPLLYRQRNICAYFWEKIPVDSNSTIVYLSKLKTCASNKWNWLISGHKWCCYTVQFSFYGLYFIQFIHLKYGISLIVSTLISSTFWISYAISNPIVNILANRSRYKQFRIFYLSASVAQFIPSLYVIYGTSDTSIAIYILILCSVLSGVGASIVRLDDVLSMQYNKEFECSDVASVMIHTLSISAGFFVNLLIAILIDYHCNLRSDTNITSDYNVYDVNDYSFGFIMITIVSICGLFLSFIVNKPDSKSINNANNGS